MPDRNVEDVPIPPDDVGPLEYTAIGEPLFTLQQAKLELAKQECAIHGHDFDVLSTVLSSDPRQVLCSRCSQTWKVVTAAPEKVLLVRVVNIEGATHPALLDSQAIAEADLVISYDDAGRCKVVKSRVPVEAVIT